MVTPEPIAFEREVVRLPDGRQLLLFHFQAPPDRAPPAPPAPAAPPTVAEEP